MTQQDLFADDRYKPPERQGVYPATSAMAKKQFEPKRDTILALTLAVWRRMEGTAEEIASACFEQYGGNQQSYRKVKAELQRRGLIQKTGMRECRMTGYKAEVFRGIASER